MRMYQRVCSADAFIEESKTNSCDERTNAIIRSTHGARAYGVDDGRCDEVMVLHPFQSDNLTTSQGQRTMDRFSRASSAAFGTGVRLASPTIELTRTPCQGPLRSPDREISLA